MKRLAPVITRLFLLIVVLAAGYFFFTKYSSSASTASLPPQFTQLANQARQKLVDTQPIINEDTQDSSEPEVMGQATSAISDQAKQILDSSAQKISTELQNLPKEQAANIIRSTCDQIISELED